MKELLTKTFWQGVKKTYDDALKGQPTEDKTLPPPAETTAQSSPEPTPDSIPTHSQPPE